MHLTARKLTIALTKITILSYLSIFLITPMTSAEYSDVETSEGNTWSASTLDIESYFYTLPFSPQNILPGETTTRGLSVESNGNTPIKYSKEYQYKSGNADLCSTLDLQAKYFWYDTDGVLQETTKYDGKLADFELNMDGSDPELAIPNMHSYYPNPNYLENEHWWSYEATLPSDATPDLSLQSCEFDIIIKAWQVNNTYPNGFTDIETTTGLITTGEYLCSAPPTVPELLAPADGYIASTDSSWIADPKMDWDDSTLACQTASTIQYQYQSFSDENLTQQRYLSGWLNNSYIPAPNTPDGTYYWHVRAKDDLGNISEYSPAWLLTVDRDYVPPQTIVLNEFLPNPVGLDDDSMPNGEWVELYNNSDLDIDANGWVLYDSNDSHKLEITASVADNNLNLTDGGETTVPAHGWLVVYRNGDSDFSLNNDGDTVRLYDDTILNSGTLIDSHTYTGTVAEGKSIARIPDGTGSWVDPLPTPGRPNAETVNDLTEQVRIWQQDSENAYIGLFDAIKYTDASYIVTYDHIEPLTHLETTEAITGTISVANLEEYKFDLFFGTCSSGGACISHNNISNVTVEVTLTGNGQPEKVITGTLEKPWEGFR